MLTPIIIILIISMSSSAIYFAKTAQYKDWATAPGVILKIEQHSDSYCIYCSYTINDHKYYSDYSYSGKATESAKNDVIKIWYIPDDPSQSSFHKASPGLDPFVPIFMCFPFLAGSIIIAIQSRKGKRLR